MYVDTYTYVCAGEQCFFILSTLRICNTKREAAEKKIPVVLINGDNMYMHIRQPRMGGGEVKEVAIHLVQCTVYIYIYIYIQYGYT